MTLSDFGVCECEGGDRRADSPEAPSPEDIERDFRSFVISDSWRVGPMYAWGNWSFWRDKGVPLMRAMGVEFGLRQITPTLERWPIRR
jgi:hypothetical protein